MGRAACTQPQDAQEQCGHGNPHQHGAAGLYTPGNAAGPLYGLLAPGRAVRWAVTDAPVLVDADGAPLPAIDILVVDSVAALVPRAEIEGEMGDSHPGLQARLMSQALRKLTSVVSKSKTCLIFINQLREKIGVMFGNPETTTGGNALKFYASVRLDIRRIGAVKDRDEVVGNQTRVKVVKNKMAPPFKQVEFQILYGEGISREGELIDLGVKHGFVEKSGAWYSYGEDRIGQGKDNARQFLLEHADTAAEIHLSFDDADIIEKERRSLGLFQPISQRMVRDAKRPARTDREASEANACL